MSPGSIKISAVICTRNRKDPLLKALEQLRRQTLPEESYEILVVDNGSTDGTAQMIQSRFADARNLRMVFEPQAGLSRARNRGWRNARAGYVAYLDDDAEVEPAWLENILKAFENSGAQASCIGGPVEVVLESRPDWFSNELLSCYASLNWGSQSFYLSENQWLVGANMAFRKDALERIGGFLEDLRYYGDETYVFRRIFQTGGKIFYEPSMKARHHISNLRISRKWILKKWFWEGAALAFLEIHFNAIPARARFDLFIKQVPGALKLLFKNCRNTGNFHEKAPLFKQTGFLAGLAGYRQ